MSLLDTHAWIGWVQQDRRRLPPGLWSFLIASNQPWAVSALSVYEVTVLQARGRLSLGLPMDEWLEAALAESDITAVAVDAEIAFRAAALPPLHGDPVDRIVIATAQTLEATLISADSKIAQYPDVRVRRTL